VSTAPESTAAARAAVTRIRRESKRGGKHKAAQMLHDDSPPEPPGAIDDDRLRLIFTCCHPALALETRVALTLRMVGGLTVPEIARAFLVQETAMGQRITRAKAKIKATRIPYRVPSPEDLPARVSGVLAVLFLVFNEGYLATGPDTDPVRHDLTAEGHRLVRERLAAVDRLADKLSGYHPYHATRADLLRRLGRSQLSRAAYDKAIELAGNTAETAYLIRRRDQLG
jgi:predicted RNA polymerase sigma factor